ncbi:MAG TPA: hypothetical protein VGD17_19445 [Chitinophagaceae bacterium]
MSDNLKRSNILLVGSGYMAREYARVLLDLNVTFDVIGRGEDNCNQFREAFPTVKVIAGGLENFDFANSYSHAIVASSVDALYNNTRQLLKKGIKTILLEKPGGKNPGEIADLAKRSEEVNANVLIAYNRRFYASVRKAKECIEEDGGVLSYNFEFTEWPHTIEGLNLDEEVKQYWFLANSSHVVDTAFYLGGKPEKMKSFTKDSLSWHSSAAVFAGAGISSTGALFSYQANWKSPGRWSVEMLTAKRRLILRPMEALQVQEQRSVVISPVEIFDQIDKDYKPGLYLQTKSFLEGVHDEFCSISEQQKLVKKYYSKMSGY